MSDRTERALDPPIWVLHPFLLAVYPLLGLYGNNVDKTPLSALVRPGAALCLAALLVWVVASKLVRDRLRGGSSGFACNFRDVDRMEPSRGVYRSPRAGDVGVGALHGRRIFPYSCGRRLRALAKNKISEVDGGRDGTGTDYPGSTH